MKGLLVFVICLWVVTLTGCSVMEKYFPSQTDANGQPLAGTHQPSDIVNTVAGYIPNGYGYILITAVAGAWNFWERVQKNKLATGLKATVMAIKQAGEDPATAEAIEKLKQTLSNAHDLTNSQKVIKDILAKI